MHPRLRLCLPHLVMLGVSIALYWAALQIDTSDARSGGRIGPDFWPKAVILFMGALCLYEVVKRALLGSDSAATGLLQTAAPQAAGLEGDSANAPQQREYPRKLLAGSALIVGYVAAITWLGFFLTTALFLAGFSYVGGYRRHGWNLLIALFGALLMVVLFMRVAYISLPLGEGPFRSLSIALIKLLGIN